MAEIRRAKRLEVKHLVTPQAGRDERVELLPVDFAHGKCSTQVVPVPAPEVLARRPVSFPEWKQVLARTNWPEDEKERVCAQVVCFLHQCKARHTPVTAAGVRAYLAAIDAEAPPMTDGSPKEEKRNGRYAEPCKGMKSAQAGPADRALYRSDYENRRGYEIGPGERGGWGGSISAVDFQLPAAAAAAI